MAKKNVSLTKKDKNPKGGLTASGRAKYNKATGGNLKAPVKGRPDSLAEMRRKGSFLVRMGSAAGPLYKNGEKTRLKLSLEAWGHNGDKASAVAKGRRLLEMYERAKKRGN